jgi:hypothetical protein
MLQIVRGVVAALLGWQSTSSRRSVPEPHPGQTSTGLRSLTTHAAYDRGAVIVAAEIGAVHGIL